MTLTELEAIARAASPGPWEDGKHSWSDVSIYDKDGRPLLTLSINDEATEETQDALEAQMDADAAHIAAFDPPTVLKLLAVARAAQESIAYHAGLAAICRTELPKQDESLRAAIAAMKEPK